MKWLWSRSRVDEGWILRLESLERQVKALVIEWDEWFDKYRRLYARLAKRVSDANKEPDVPEEPQAPQAPERPPGWERDKSYLRRLAAQLTNQQRNGP